MSKSATAPQAVHLVLQGKGGVGKSVVASFLGQFFLNKSIDVACFDTDPVNQTLLGYKALNATHINLLVDGRINEKSFDGLIEHILTERRTYVIDNGASCFVPLSRYLDDNQIFSILKEAGIPVFIHCVIVGGASLLDTLSGLNALAGMTASKNIVVWKNEFQGEIIADGKNLHEMKAFIENKDKVLGVITLPKRNHDTFGDDLQALLSAKLTFEEGIKSEEFSIMAKQRLKIMQRDIFGQIEALEFVNG